jgi:hypothetical protein
MQPCPHKPIAIRVHRRTIDMIRALDDSVVLEGNEDKFFMIYCADSDHEEYQTIDKETYDRTYEPMPPYVMAMSEVQTID